MGGWVIASGGDFAVPTLSAVTGTLIGPSATRAAVTTKKSNMCLFGELSVRDSGRWVNGREEGQGGGGGKEEDREMRSGEEVRLVGVEWLCCSESRLQCEMLNEWGREIREYLDENYQ